MDVIDTVVVGGGQAGLALSHWLTELDRDHVVLERGRVAERWRSERWDSLRLLSPNWMTRLPGGGYDGPDPDGYMSASQLAELLDRYASSFDAPVLDQTTVVAVEPAGTGAGYRVVTDRGTWAAANVVVATGWSDRPLVPAAAAVLAGTIHQVTPSSYRNPDRLPDGGVLVVGASASGVQLADELLRSGRDVVLAVGGHSRLPRRYRGMDIWWWMDRLGVLDETIDDAPDRAAARHEPSLQLVGRPTGENLDLATLQSLGVRLAGHLRHIDGHRVAFAEDLGATTAAAEARMRRMLAAIDRYVDGNGLAAEVLDPERIDPVTPGPALDSLDLRAAGIATVVWATGFRRDYSWLHVPVLDASGEIAQRRGVTPAPGLYVLGLRFQHHRNSSFIDGVGRDAGTVAAHIAARSRTPLPAKV
jgi:putative flavoprotein involved in K+ transport